MKPHLRVIALVLSITSIAVSRVETAPADGTSSALADEADGRNWASYGRTYSEQHASPLTRINKDNIERLGLAWSMELPGVHQGATVPLAVDGVIYFTVDQSKIRAVDAASGRLLWLYDPKAGERAGPGLRFSFGSRGIAYWDHKIYCGTADGRLIAIDARSGTPVWSAKTTEPGDHRYITGAPRVFDGLVVIGHGGADTYGVRGYVTAYDARTGMLRWRFFVVPGDPHKGFENAAMEMAAKTWKGEWWKYGGGGTVWNAITYDPELDLVYIGTGNGSPWNRKIRSAGAGDNLFLCAIVALDARTGEYRWHYQTTPGESWDYKSTADITLATLRIGGVERKVILHAPTNGFFYVIDRTNGKLISAEKFAKVTWAQRIDLQTGRPVENAGIRYESGETSFFPGSAGAHNWQPMAFNEHTGLVYIPTMEMEGYWNDRGVTPQNFTPVKGQLNTGLNMQSAGSAPVNAPSSELQAWDPVAQKTVWKVDTPLLWNGGAMTTAGGLVFQGQGDGWFNAYDATTGRRVWRFYANMGIAGAPITYEVKGRQYVTVVAGWGSVAAAALGPISAVNGWIAGVHPHRLLTFVLDGTAKLATDLPEPFRAVPVDDASFEIDPRKEAAGAALYSVTCLVCHGAGAVAGGFAPDLRASMMPLSAEGFAQTVHRGIKDAGMPDYPELTSTQLDSLRHFIRARARESLKIAR